MTSRTMIGADEAMALVLDHARCLAPIPLSAQLALGLTLAERIVADRDCPPFDRSIMDGFAVRVAHRGRSVAIGGEARPGRVSSPEVTADTCVEIMTGAPCPRGTEAVVMKEEVRMEGRTATFPPSIAQGQNIMARGAEAALGATILPEGATLTPLALGLLAAVGRREVRVHPAPTLALLITGDEIVAEGTVPLSVEIRDSNGPMLLATAYALGVTRVSARGVRDTEESLAAALDEASHADIVVLTGGVSAGNYDLVPAALLAHGATIVFHKVRQQPGKPILFATKGSQLFFGLPGTPLGCHLGFHHYVGAAVRALAGRPQRVEEQGHLAQAWSTTSERQQFVLAHVVDKQDGSHEVTPLRLKGSSDLFTPWNANAYMNVREGTRTLEAGDVVRFDWLPGTR